MRTFWARILKTVLTLGALGYLVAFIHPSEIAAALENVRLRWIVGAVVLLPVHLALDALIWQRLLRPVAPDVPWRKLWSGLLSGYTLGFVTPARAGEFAGRAFSLPDADAWSVSLTVFVQRLIDTTISVTLGAFVLVYVLVTETLTPTVAWSILAVIGGGFGVLLIGFLARPDLGARLVRRVLPRRPAVYRRVDLLHTYAPRSMAGTIGWAVLRYSMFCAQFVMLLYAFTPTPSLGHVLVAVALIFFVKFILPSVTLMDLGIQEGAAVFFLGLFGIPSAIAFNAALLLFLITLVLPAAVGLPFVAQLRFRTTHSTLPSRG